MELGKIIQQIYHLSSRKGQISHVIVTNVRKYKMVDYINYHYQLCAFLHIYILLSISLINWKYQYKLVISAPKKKGLTSSSETRLAEDVSQTQTKLINPLQHMYSEMCVCLCVYYLDKLFVTIAIKLDIYYFFKLVLFWTQLIKTIFSKSFAHAQKISENFSINKTKLI